MPGIELLPIHLEDVPGRAAVHLTCGLAKVTWYIKPMQADKNPGLIVGRDLLQMVDYQYLDGDFAALESEPELLL